MADAPDGGCAPDRTSWIRPYGRCRDAHHRSLLSCCTYPVRLRQVKTLRQMAGWSSSTSSSAPPGPSSSVSRALFSSTSGTLNDSHLCFNKANFNRADFNVDRFVNVARRRANLAQIHNDLRVYLKIVQNSMIELINDDYADFVNLSSNLVGLKETIDKLCIDIETIWNELCSSTREVMTTAEFIEKQASDLNECRSKQLDIRARIALINAIERLADRLSAEPSEVDHFWLTGLGDAVVDMEVWYRKLMKPEGKLGDARGACLRHVQKMCEQWLVRELDGDCRLTGALLGVLTLVDGVDSAVSRVMTEVIDTKIDKRADNLGDLLERAFDFVLKVRENWLTKLKDCGARISTVSPFLDKCLLTYIVSLLDQHFGSVLVPSNNRLFHRCYLSTCGFISGWPDAGNSRIVLRMIRDRFNLVVYFKLETQQFLADFTECSRPALLRLPETSAGDGSEDRLFCECSKIVVKALSAVWSDEKYLPSLVDKLWDFTLKMLTKFLNWVTTVFKYFTAEGGSIENVDTWRLLCAVCADCASVDAFAFEIALSSIWEKLRELELDVAPFGQCLSVFSSRLAKQRKELESAIADILITSIAKLMESVSDIPRQYRWTKKPVPTEASAYVNDAIVTFEAFQEEISKQSWSEEDGAELSRTILSGALDAFCKKAEQVLDSVEQTGTSLQRFKRKAAGSASAEGSALDTDDAKIRSQLLLDLSHCRQLAGKLDVQVPQLEKVMIRATVDATKSDS